MIDRNRGIDTRLPIWFKIWFGLCATLGIAFVGLIAWAIVRFVSHYT